MSHRSLERHRAVCKGTQGFLTKRSFPSWGSDSHEKFFKSLLALGMLANRDRSRGQNVDWWYLRGVCFSLSVSSPLSLSSCLLPSPRLLLSDFLPASIPLASQTERVHSTLSRRLPWAYCARGTGQRAVDTVVTRSLPTRSFGVGAGGRGDGGKPRSLKGTCCGKP